MKKIICFFATFIAGFIILCVPSFAADNSQGTVKFDDYFAPSDIILGGLSSGQYMEIYDEYNRTFTATHDYAFETLKYWGSYCRVRFKPEGISKGTRLIFDLKVDIYLDDRVSNINNIYPKILLNDGGSWSKAGTYTVLKDWNSSTKTISMLYKVDYIFKYDASSVMFTFDMPSHDQTLTTFREVQYHFPEFVSNFYLGSGSNPGLPSYTDPSEYMDGPINDYTSKEDEVLSATEEGKEIFGTSYLWLVDATTYFGNALLAISRCFDYILSEIPVLDIILRFSLSLGLVAYVLNIGASIVRSISRKKGGGD